MVTRLAFLSLRSWITFSSSWSYVTSLAVHTVSPGISFVSAITFLSLWPYQATFTLRTNNTFTFLAAITLLANLAPITFFPFEREQFLERAHTVDDRLEINMDLTLDSFNFCMNDWRYSPHNCR